MATATFAERVEKVLVSCVPQLGMTNLSSVSRLPGGLSFETYIVDGEAGSQHLRCILRREPAGGPLEPYDVAFEADCYRSLKGSPVPVPDVYHLEQDPAVLDRPFIVSEFVAGLPRVHSNPRFDDEATRDRTLHRYTETLANIHKLPVSEVPRGPGGSSLGTREEVRLWRSRFASVELSPRPVVRHAFDVLEALATDDHPMVMVHGDYRLSNVLWDERDNVTAVLDWERSFIGDPMADIAYTRNRVLAGWCSVTGRFGELYTSLTGFEIDRLRVRFWQLFELLKGVYVGMACAASLVRGSSSDLRLMSVASASTAIEPVLLKMIVTLSDSKGV